MKLFPEWAVMMLKLAGIANVFWGLTFTLFSDILFRWAGMPDPQYFFSWKMTGIMALVFGVAFFISAFNPGRHIMVIVMGFIIKLLELIFMLHYWAEDVFSLKLVLYFAAKDMVWLIPFAIVIYLVFRSRAVLHDNQPLPNAPLSDILEGFHTVSRKSLKQLSDESPVLLIFLKHFSSPLCHEAMADILNKREMIEREGVKIVLVHMGSVEEAKQFFNQYNLQCMEHISDPDGVAYQAFKLKRAHFRQIFNQKILGTGKWREHSLSKLIRNTLRLPGAFLIYKGELLKSYRQEGNSDSPDYMALASH